MKIKKRKLKYCRSLSKRKICTRKHDTRKKSVEHKVHAIIKKYYCF